MCRLSLHRRSVVELFRLKKISFKKARGSLGKASARLEDILLQIIADALIMLMREKEMAKRNNHKDT